LSLGFSFDMIELVKNYALRINNLELYSH